ncbi:MAG TPA: biotin/lipoyl-containing protein, partial [Calidithermus sp.]|nr:biotin/lipoyl-containing protein [Calidithermus sp.]
MTREFRLPDLGEGLHEAEIVKVLVREGDEVQEDAPLLEVETDKAQVEIPSPVSGRVEKVHVAPGQVVRVGQVLVTFGDGGRPPASGAEPAAEAGRDREAVAVRRDVAAGPVPATPATRRLAR